MTVASAGEARRAPLLVRRRDIDDTGTHAGRFRERAIAPAALPRIVTRGMGWFCVDTELKIAALTYDDGPHPVHTPAILDVLSRHGVPATFFALSGPARRHPEILRRAVAEGSEIALHGHDHASLKQMGLRETYRMLRSSRRIVEGAAGTRIRLYRPPYLQYRLAQLPLIRLAGMTLAMSSGAAEDWVHDEESAIAARGMRCVFPGSIVLLHDDRADPETAQPDEALPAFDRAQVTDLIVTDAIARGYDLVTFSGLMTRARGVSSLLRNT
ncbi:polysaccharide deacetylase family protein [uncultured Microbacterium sp.]|uniref:polysaccharide deacetylase family protein n=1 Tax=uncultured Microbacterium sp. TaxID=191216 RepID=UPI00262E69B0|nr:polysaccharide deacetylase family protein [uncultured Microbacterium sp.]